MCLDDPTRGSKQTNSNIKVVDLFEQISKNEYTSIFEQLEFAYARTINLGNEFWRFLEIDGNHHLCLYHQLNKQFIMFKPDHSLLCFPWPYDGIIDISWSKTINNWIVATQTQIVSGFSFSSVEFIHFYHSLRLFAIVHSVEFFNQLISQEIGPNE